MIKFNSPATEYSNSSNILKIVKNKDLIKNKNYNFISNFIQREIYSKYFSLTQSGSDALEVAFKLLQLKKNDEVILPSFTFSATANAIILNNANPVFCDVNKKDLCIDLRKAEKLITKKTKAICLVHYAGNSCDMEYALYLKKKFNLYLVEDSAHALFAKYKKRYCGTIGDVGIFSFHATKNFTSAQGGAISVNNRSLIKRSKIILNKGNGKIKNNKDFFQWLDVGSEYQMSEYSAALLRHQINNYKKIQLKRRNVFFEYANFFSKHKFNTLQSYSSINTKNVHSYHIFYILFKKNSHASSFIHFMKKRGIEVTRHYFPLHLSEFGMKFRKSNCGISKNIYDKIVRLPIHTKLDDKDIKIILNNIKFFFNNINEK